MMLIATASTHESPNILLIIVDDMGLNATSCYEVAKQQPNMASEWMSVVRYQKEESPQVSHSTSFRCSV